ncbi:metaxin-2-like [Liolophura sinensis]|uniref:metaxin-2-like n=1 Tax=Liolophura sinensis TaxID=3198878 RepID=UPI003158EBB4
MTSLVSQAVSVELGPQVPWPENVSFYQPYESDQILLPDCANCLAVKTFLHMNGLNFLVELRTNAEEMSPSGRVPFIQVGAFLISELDPIIAFVNTKGFNLSENLNEIQRSEMRAYMSLVENILVNAELYICWCEDTVYSQVTKKRHGSIHPWPLNHLLPWKRRQEIKSRMKSTGWGKKTMNDVCDEVITCCQALSERLDRQKFFFGEKPTELDALVFGHLYSILTTNLPVTRLAEIIRGYPNLAEFCRRIDETYYRESDFEEV